MSRKILQVSEFTREARDLLEEHFGTVWLTGEISNLATPASGHIYFSLKDDHAQIRRAFVCRESMLYLSPVGRMRIERRPPGVSRWLNAVRRRDGNGGGTRSRV